MLKAKLLGATAGAEAALAIEDVFSTYLYTGNGSTQTINNGIDLAGEGGLVWIKSRSAATDNFLFDTVRGTTKEINSNSTAVEATLANSLTAFNANGFSIGSATGIGVNAATYASWTFRKAPRFFDVVTWVGNGSSTQTIPHGLGAAPGCIIIKDTNFAQNWWVYHTSRGTSKYLVLNSTAAEVNSSIVTATSGADFTVSSTVTSSGRTHVAYLFAHDPLGPSGDGSDGLIACGSYTGNGSTTGPVVSLGWEPQWVMIKASSKAGDNWRMFDTMRGMDVNTTGSGDAILSANTTAAEVFTNRLSPTATGFQLTDTAGDVNTSGATYIYIAIRRGPMREPTVGTEVFFASKNASSTSGPVPTGFPVDLFMNKATLAVTSSPRSWWVFDRMRGSSKQLSTDSSDAEPAFDYSSFIKFDSNTTFTQTSSNSDLGYFFRRAPGFFDVVAYTGNGVAGRTVPHNLGVAPEMMIVKCRSQSTNWPVYHSGLNVDGDGRPETDYLILSQTQAAFDNVVFWNDTAPDSSAFTLGTNVQVNQASSTYIAYLFASLPGISKVGSYTGNGSSQTINCAFTTGARFVLIKRTDSTGDWYVWDTARGIVAGNDPHLSLNTTAAEVTTDDTIDPDNSGFIVNQVAATNVNVNAATYIYLAIA